MTAKKVVALFFWWASCSIALGQNFPAKPIRILVPTIAGSAPDVRVRQIAPKLSDAVGQPVIVDNRPGANGTIATQLAARAVPDGHTLLYGLINNAINDALHPDACCRLNIELLPVIHFTSTPLVMVIHPSVAANTLQEYLQLAKSKPGALTYASAGPGSITQMLGEWIKLKSGTRILDVPYKSVGAEMPDLLGGQIMTAYLNPLAVAPHIRSGKLRGLAVAGPKRIAAFQDVPTIAEAGLPGVDGIVWNGFFVPAGTPKQNIQILNREIQKTFDAPDVREQVAAIGADIIGGSPESYAAFIRNESAKWSKLIRDVGIKAE